ncbi:hypothetical protein FRC17_001937, partial [Serendipita sp. 399]
MANNNTSGLPTSYSRYVLQERPEEHVTSSTFKYETLSLEDLKSSMKATDVLIRVE